MTRSIRGASLACALLVVLATTVATAQQPSGRGGRGFGGMMGGGRGGDPTLRLLTSPEVQKDLELVDDQVTQLKAIGEDVRAKMQKEFSGIRDLPRDQQRARFTEMQAKLKPITDEAVKKVQEVLLPHQVDRLKELSIQVRGAGALADAKVQEDLGLSADQKTKLTKIQEDATTAIRAMFDAARNLDDDARRAKFAENREKTQKMIKDASDEALNVLTTDQKDKLEKMKGKILPNITYPQQQRGGPQRGGNRPQQTTSK